METIYSVGIEVYKQDIAYKDYTSNPIPSFFYFAMLLLILLHNLKEEVMYIKVYIGLGLLVYCSHALSCRVHTTASTSSFHGLCTAIPASL